MMYLLYVSVMLEIWCPCNEDEGRNEGFRIVDEYPCHSCSRIILYLRGQAHREFFLPICMLDQ